MKAIKKLKKFIWSIFVLLTGLILLLMGYLEIAMLLIILSLFGISWRIHILRKNIEPNSEKWANVLFIYLIIFFIIALFIRYIAFNIGINILHIIGGATCILAIYIYFRFIVPKLIIKQTKLNSHKKRETSNDFWFFSLFIVLGLFIFLFVSHIFYDMKLPFFAMFLMLAFIILIIIRLIKTEK